jgi:uncharacterized membrane protein YobD (UPF0266 family)
MENLIIKPRQLISRKIVGGLWILLGIILLFIRKGSLSEKDWMASILFCVIGIISFTPLAGSVKSQIEIEEGCLKIIWINWILKVTVLDSEIESIILAENGVLIKRKDKRPLKIKFYLLDGEQKNQVFEFFTKYAREKNFVLEK